MADTENISSKVTIKTEKEDYDEESPMVDMESLVKVEMTEDVVVNDVNALITNFNKEFEDDQIQDEEANIISAANPLALVDFDKTIFPSKEKRLAIRNKSTIISKHPVAKLKCLEYKEERKKRKVELERERRRELTELYDELQFQVCQCDKMDDEGLSSRYD